MPINQSLNPEPSFHTMERRLLRPAHSYKLFREDCGFTMEDWTSFHERVQNALLQPRNYVALQKPYLHREAWEEWLQKLLDTGLAEVYWSVNCSRKWNVVENGEVIRAFIRDVVIALAAEISRARNRIAREINYIKNIEPPECPASARSRMDDPEPNALPNIKAEAPLAASGTAEKRPHPNSVIRARKLEVAPSVPNHIAPMAAALPPLPPTSLPLPSPREPLVKLHPVREVVDIERYDPDDPIELIPEGYVKQFVIDDNGGNHNKITLLKDPTYNSHHPKKRQAKERREIPNKLPRNHIPQNLPRQKISFPPTPTTPTAHPPRGSRAQGDQVLTPDSLPRSMPYILSQEVTPVPAERKHNWAAKGARNTGRRKVGIKSETESDGDDEHDEDGTGTDTEGERKVTSGISRRNIRSHNHLLRTKRRQAW